MNGCYQSDWFAKEQKESSTRFWITEFLSGNRASLDGSIIRK